MGITNSLVAVFPGSFDPPTNGHLDLIARATRLTGKLIVAVLSNENKQALFPAEERIAMLQEAASLPGVEFVTFDGLLVDFAAKHGATVVLRGIRAVSDYEYELQMALMNRRLNPNIETIFLMSGEENSFVSSRLVKEVARLGGDVSGMVPKVVHRRLRERFQGDLSC